MSYKCDGCNKTILSVSVTDKKIVVQPDGDKTYTICSWYCMLNWAYAIDDGQISLEDE